MADEGGLVRADSTVLAHIMTLLNERYDYGLDLCLLSIDEGISGYRDASLDVSTLRHSFHRSPPTSPSAPAASLTPAITKLSEC